ncbi:MAG: tetratricopeptide repeat protein [Emcibacteraceae bacterium]|nr:tetratricopeptide repeat protein [Emcibacteraceae bacterium]
MTNNILNKPVLKTFLAVVGFTMLAACSSPEEIKQAHYENGMELLDEQNIIKASLEFRNALQIDDTFVPAWYGLSLVEEEKKEWVKVNVILNKIIELEPTHLNAQVRLGTLLMMAGQLDKAVEISETLLLLDNQNADVLSLRAAILLKLEDAEGAIEFANKSLNAEPGNVKAIQILAAERYTKRDYDGALAFIAKANPDELKSKDLLYITILIHETKGDIEQAEATFKQMVDSYPEDQEVRIAFVNFYVQNKDIDAAEQVLRDLAALDPSNFDRSIDVVRFLNSYRGEKAAEDELTNLIQRGTDVVRYQLALAEFHLTNNKREEAKIIFGRIVDRTGSSEDGLIAGAKLAAMAISEGNTEQASEIIAQILEIDPINVSALEMRGSINLNDNKYDNAIQDLRIVLSETPQSVRASILLSSAYELSGSIELADDTLADAVRFSDNDSSVAIAYANFLIKQSAPARAENVLMEVMKFKPSDTDILKSLARVRLIRQDWLGAQQIADAIKKLDENDDVSNEIEGLAFNGQQNYEQSILSFKNAYEQSNSSTRPLASLINAYIRAGKTVEAENFLDSVLVDDPDNYQALILLGRLYNFIQTPDEAVKVFEKAIAANPEVDTAYMSLLSHYIRSDDNASALKVTERALSSVENKVGLQLMKAHIFEREKDFEAAIRVYEEMYAENSTIDIVVNNLASLLSEHRTDNESMNRAQALAVRFRQSSIPHFKDTLGWIYYKTGDIQSATSILQDAVEQLPTNIYFRYHLGMAYMANERHAAAGREFEEVIKLSETQPFEELQEVKDLLAGINPSS